eukprot:TRINITY_DN495_c0_g1_i1.p1 TRINITY_DN495_c0_g1~~TRINITY_DN495_c0_g1_i1.p1  ORF type:complete len:970 (+),score=514.19 TRINITY_DN495_c0_g1_i1:170-3079(+)
MPRKFDPNAAPWYHPYKDKRPLDERIEEIMSSDLPEHAKRRAIFNMRSVEQKEIIIAEVILETPLEKMFEAYDPNRVEKRVVAHFNDKFIRTMTERGCGHLIYSDTDPSLTYFEEIYYLQEGSEERDENGNLRIPMQTQRLHPQSNLELLPHYSPSAYYYSEKRDYDYDKKKAKLDALIAKHENNQDMDEEDVPDRKYEDVELPPGAPDAGFMPNYVHEYKPRIENPGKAYEEVLTPSMLANASDLIVTPAEKKLYNINLRIDEIPELPEWIEIRDKVRLLVKKRLESGHTVLENVDDELNTFLRQWLPSDHSGPDRDLLHEDLDFFKIDDGEYDMTFWEGLRHKPPSKRFFVPKIPSRITEAPGWYDQNGDRINLHGELLQDVDEEQDMLEPSDLDKLLGRVPKRMKRRVYEKAYELDPEAPVPRVPEFEPKAYRKVYKVDRNSNDVNENIPVDFNDHDHKLSDEMWFFLGKPRNFTDSLKGLFTGRLPDPITQGIKPGETTRKKRAQLDYEIFRHDAENQLDGPMVDDDGTPLTDDDLRSLNLPGYESPALCPHYIPVEKGGWRYTLHRIIRGTIDFIPNFATALRETSKRNDALNRPNLPLENDPDPPVTPGDPPRLRNDGCYYDIAVDDRPSEKYIKIHDEYVLTNPKAYDPDGTIGPKRDAWGNAIHNRELHRDWAWPSWHERYPENMDDEEYGLGALSSMTLALPPWYFDIEFTDERDKDDHDPEFEEDVVVGLELEPRPFEKLWKSEVFYNSPWASTRSNEIRLGEPHPLSFFPSDAYGHDFEDYDRDLDNGNDFDEYEPPVEDYVEMDMEYVPQEEFLARPINMQERLKAAAASAAKDTYRPKFPVIISEFRIDDPFDMIKFEDYLLNTDILGSHGSYHESEKDPYYEIGKPPTGSLANNAAIGFAGGALAGAIMGFYMARRYGRTSVAFRTAGVYALTLGCTFGSFLFLGSLIQSANDVQ